MPLAYEHVFDVCVGNCCTYTGTGSNYRAYTPPGSYYRSTHTYGYVGWE
jgi:hypothetical protein